MQRLGFKPTTAVRGTPTLVKKLSAGRKVQCKTFLEDDSGSNLSFAIHLVSKWFILEATAEVCCIDLSTELFGDIQIGYDATHTCESDSWIATFPLGYADGLWRAQGQRRGRVIRDKTGE